MKSGTITTSNGRGSVAVEAGRPVVSDRGGVTELVSGTKTEDLSLTMTCALVEKLDAGEVSVSAAADIATLPEEEQTEIVAKGEKEILQAAKGAKVALAGLAGTYRRHIRFYY